MHMTAADDKLYGESGSIPGNELWFIFRDQTLLVKNLTDAPAIPSAADVEAFRRELQTPLAIGPLRGLPCRAATLEKGPTGLNFSFVDLRTLLDAFDEDEFCMAGRALQLVNWSKNNRFCGRCGTPAQALTTERAMHCPSCNLTVFPRISPAIIVAVIRDGRILLARHSRTKTGMRTVLAGYLEPGESFETCVEREVFEEVQVRVKNLRYFASQPWPFPDALMIAFTAEYAGGEIIPDGVEILDADWYAPGALPFTPGPRTVAGKLIAWFVEKYGNE